MPAVKIAAPKDSANDHGPNSIRRSDEIQFTTTSYPSRCLQFLHHPSEGRPFYVQQQATPGLLMLDVLVVGAGLGGLAAAIAMRRKGFKVQVFEKTSALGEVGAGIQIPPNSGRLLQKWGVMKHLESRAVRPDCITFRRWQSGDAIGFTDLGGQFSEVYQAPYYVAHRADYHMALSERARELGITIHLKSKVVEYNTAAGSIMTSDGQVFRGDLIVAADGVKSVAREVVGAGKEGAPKPTGYAAYRATVDVDKLAAIPEVSWILESLNLNVWIGPDRHVMSYMIAGGKSLNLVLSHVDKSDPEGWASMSQAKVLEDMRKEFDSWDPELRKIIGLIDHALKWPLLGGTKLESWTAANGRLVILGDAAHTMLPYMSQGAAMAIEDAGALAIVLSKLRTIQELPFGLHVFENERQRRSGQMQEASAVNSMIWHFEDGPLQQARDEAMRPEVEGRPFLYSPNQWTDPITQDWAYGYDAENRIQEAWDGAFKPFIE